MSASGELLRELVGIASINPRGGPVDAASGIGEAAVAEYVRDWLTARGVRAELREVLPGRPNVVATLPGRDPRVVLLESHLDTVETGGMIVDPFAGTIRDGRLYGRGACDAKGPLAAFMLALANLAQDGPPPFGVVLAGVMDEEHLYRGVLGLIDDLADTSVVGAVVGEPTGLVAATAHKGVVRYTVRTLGTAGHSSRPDKAVNAVTLMARVIGHVNRTPPGVPAHPLLGSATRCVTGIRGGEGPNTVPGRCEIDIDRRTLPGEDPLDVWRADREELTALIPGHIEVDEPFTVDYSLDTPAGSPVPAALCRSLAAAGRDASVHGMPFATDASKLARAGIPSVVFGPGSISHAHSADESIALAEVDLAARVITETVRSLDVEGRPR
ncbi:acetylornithine deacetylase [Actinomadura pelletieri DSM 43383]|uniref:Acetylornithine deacetylase n=1 Tax=Actinomadura pelletieri DSM 43383 TaxID=1120940 RepID=A0A495QZA9_9ACTN|nr:M20 family metallopeptidase [Actinomadura pelletieri]RKS79523.1 acetylornithine deacetylase [Actinomadura pelletieri DSM 43383]